MVTHELEGRVGRWQSSGRPLPIGFRVRVGVTGHRQLDDDGRVRDALTDRLVELRQWFARTQATPVYFSIVTALAEGADRLVPRDAQRVLGEDQTTLEAVLPLTVEDYLEDFETEESREEFRELLRGAASQVVLADGPKPAGDDRTAAYERAGRYIVDTCDVMVAVWDGQPSRGRGGTGEIVRYARDQEVPVLVVPTQAGCSNQAEASVRSPRLRATLASFRWIDDYNSASLPDRFVARAKASTQRRLDAVSDKRLIQSQVDHVASWTDPHLVRADALALRYQAHHVWLARAVHFFALGAVITVAAQVVFARREPRFLVIEIVLLIALLASVWLAQHGRTHERWVGNRSLAEAFRSAFFIALSGASDRSSEGGRPEMTPGDQPWPQRAFSETWRSRPSVSYQDDAARPLRECLVSGWIDPQIRYHQDTARRYERERRLYTRAISVLALITIVIATIHIVIAQESSGLEFVAILLPGVGAAITGLRERGQHRVHQDRCNRTVTRLKRLKSQLEEDPTLESVRRLAIDTHRIMVEENQDWWGVIEYQDIELVI